MDDASVPPGRGGRGRIRLLIALAVSVIVFGGVYGLASSLSITSASLGAATTTVAACQSGTLSATYSTTYSSSLPGYTVSTVTVGGLASTCYGMPYRVTLTGASNTSLGEATGTTPTSGSSFAASGFSSTVSAAQVIGISVVISG